MNTFVCETTFEASARSLDRARLGKQRLEVHQMLRALGWHPPRRRPDTNAEEAWTAYEQAMSREET